jgi:5-methylcytosine-specific restriction endonuclease McrA
MFVTLKRILREVGDRTCWVYKCNSGRFLHGDWNEVFAGQGPQEWGSTEYVRELSNAKPGQIILAFQTDRNELVGVAKVKHVRRRGKFSELILTPICTIGVKVRPLKADPKVDAIDALKPGKVQTLYDITTPDAKRLLRAAYAAGETNGPTLPVRSRTTTQDRLFHRRVSILRRKRITKVPIGQATPIVVETTAKAYQRDLEVAAWLLQNARGKCEVCRRPAPFIGDDGKPFLECHHVRPLADGGSDTPTNAVAICPNCHRRSHHGIDRKEFKARIYAKISRLVVE